MNELKEIYHEVEALKDYDSYTPYQRQCNKILNMTERLLPDMEKVINGLKCCSQMAGEACRKCPYTNECEDGLFAGSAHLAADALTLLQGADGSLRIWEDKDGSH